MFNSCHCNYKEYYQSRTNQANFSPCWGQPCVSVCACVSLLGTTSARWRSGCGEETCSRAVQPPPWSPSFRPPSFCRSRRRLRRTPKPSARSAPLSLFNRSDVDVHHAKHTQKRTVEKTTVQGQAYITHTIVDYHYHKLVATSKVADWRLLSVTRLMPLCC